MANFDYSGPACGNADDGGLARIFFAILQEKNVCLAYKIYNILLTSSSLILEEMKQDIEVN